MLRHLRGRGSRLIYPLAALWLQTLVIAASVEAQNLSFIARKDFAAGGGFFPLAVGDFNGDGVQDLATGGSVLLGNGDGTFQTARNFAVAGWVAVGDFNGDRVQDLAVANSVSNNVSVLRGKGDGTFQVARNFAVGSGPNSIAVGDFNGDGFQDLAVTNAASNNVSVLLGSGDGAFQEARSFDAGNDPLSIAVDDFNGDRVQDLAVANFARDSGPNNANTGFVSVLLGKGDGTFQTAQNFVVGSNPRSLAVADFNGDGLRDLVTAGLYAVTVLQGKGDGTFQAAVKISDGTGVAVGDFNGDGHEDLVTSGSVLLGNGDGTFQSALGSGGGGSLVGDFNGDGFQDLAGAGFGFVSVVLGNGDGTFQTAWDVGVGKEPSSIAVGDFNGDGLQDLAVANSRSDDVSVVDGTLQTVRNFGAGVLPFSVAVGDFDGDRVQDLAVANVMSDNITVLRGNGDGTFQTARSFGAGKSPISVAVGDFNGDRVQDLAAGNFNSNDFTSSSVSVLLGNGDGTFQAARSIGVGRTPNSIAVGDFNGDGFQDLVVAVGLEDRMGEVDTDHVSVLLGNGDGTFQAAVKFGAGAATFSVAVGDFNGDRIQDLAVANFWSSNVSVLLGNGNATFQMARNFSVGSKPRCVAVGDLNGDRIQDLAVANSESGDVSVLLGNGNGTFQTAVNFGVGSGPVSVAVVDFNGDGLQDLAVANKYSNNVSVLINKLTLSSTSVFPQIAVGAGYRTSVIGVNTGPTSAAAEISFRKSDGGPLGVTVNEASDSNLGRIIAPMGSVRLEATSTDGLAAGYARFRSNAALNGTVLLKTVRGSTITSQAGLALSTPTKNFTAYVDNANNALSGYAVANFGTVHATLAMTLRNKKGMMLETQTVNLGPGRHFAEFASERFPTTAGAGFEGSIEFTSDQSVAAVAVRYDNINLDVFTTIPVLVNEMATTLYFPQVADGATYRTNFILVNPSNAAAFATLEFFDSNGAPLAFPIEGVERIRHIVPLSGKGVARLVTDGTSSGIKVGWVRVTCPVAIGGSAIFQTVVRERITSEAGVGASPLAARFLTYVESLGFAESGLALCNPGSFGLTVTFNLRNFSGRIVASTRRTLPAFGHMAQFFTQLFPTDFGEFEGTLEVVVAGASVSAVALRYDNPGADVFATLPVIVIP